MCKGCQIIILVSDTMLRCEKCGGNAIPALAHLHGRVQLLCRSCAQPYIDENSKCAKCVEQKIDCYTHRPEAKKIIICTWNKATFSNCA